jgi:Transposase and inactivated derivatives
MLYSLDLRERVVSAIEEGMSKKQASELFNVCRETIYQWLRLKATQGDLSPQVGFQKGHSHKIKDLERFKAFVDKHGDYTQEETAKHFGVSLSTIGRALRKIGYTRKKRAKLMQKEMNRKGKSI